MPRLPRTSPFYVLPLILLIAAMAAIAGCNRPDDQTEDRSPAIGDSMKGEMAAGDASTGTVVAEGSFVDKGGQTTGGSYRIESDNGQLRLLLGGDFRTDEGPDLHVVLSPAFVDDVESENAMSDDAALVVGPLSGLEGPQQYDLPAGLDLSAYHSVLIHCIEFSHLYGAAPVASR